VIGNTANNKNIDNSEVLEVPVVVVVVFMLAYQSKTTVITNNNRITTGILLSMSSYRGCYIYKLMSYKVECMET
jgi:hypothetical protein